MINYQDTCVRLNQANSIVEFIANSTISLADSEIVTINSLAIHLSTCGVTKGSMVAIIANTRREWVLADLAILSLGAISVSVYQSLTPAEIAFILSDSKCAFVFAENQEQILKLDEIVSKSWDIPVIEDRPATNVKVTINGVLSFEEASSDKLNLVTLNALAKNDSQSTLFFEKSVQRNDLASIVYTSGTTGPPKGVMQTHGNHLSNVRQVLESGLMLDKGSIFLFLPLAHSFARLMAYITLFSPLELKLPKVTDTKTSKIDMLTLANDLRQANSEILPVVPRFLEKIKTQLETVSSRKNLSSRLLKLTLTSALSHYKLPSITNSLLYSISKPIRNKIITKIFGNNFKYGVSGGAKLPSSVQIFFESLGMTIVQGYGLTETCVATNACRPLKNKIGSVGPVLSQDIEIKILEDQEIAVRGPNVAIGYLNRPKATAESWTTDNWFLTGDQGSIDQDGFLFITGRKKELIVTSGGKKIPPLPIEEMVLEHRLFSQAVLVGEGRKYLSVIVSINKDEAFDLTGIPPKAQNQQELLDLSYNFINKVNEKLASYESIKKVLISPYEFSIENGLLTPSMKIKRKEVENRFRSELDQIYESNL